MPDIAAIFARYGPEYLRAFGERMLPSHLRAFRDILDCRTDALGGHIFACDHCARERYSYHSCRHRSCPKCHRKDTDSWLEERGKELLPVTHYHLVFTIPQELRDIVRSRQNALFDILMKAAARALIKLAADPRYVGGLVGVLCVLHTWTRALVYHPHVHCLVPAGGISPDQTQWHSARNNYLVPVRALSVIFRGLFRDMVRRNLPDLEIPRSVWKRSWVVYCKPAIQGKERVLRYLARYVHRIAITQNRILSIDGGKITFRYKDSRRLHWKMMTLSAVEFIRRFLQHVLPAGFHKVRYYGLWSPAHRQLLRQVQLILAREGTSNEQEAPETDIVLDGLFPTHPVEGRKCPHCGIGTLVWMGHIPRRGRDPP